MSREVNKSSDLTQALKKITYGFYIVSSKKDDYMAASTVCWVSQVSIEPPLVMAAVQKNSNLANTISKSGVMAISVIGKAEKAMINEFAKENVVDGHKINGYITEKGQTGAPLIKKLPAFVEGKIVETIDQGDHTIFIAEATNSGVRNPDAEPLMEWETEFHYGG